MAQDISNLYVSESFQNLVLVSSSAEGNILADALGNEFIPLSAESASSADYANQAGTADSALIATSASYAATASFALNVTTPTLQEVTDAGATSTNTITADIIGDLTGNADTATSASHAIQADSALAADTATSSSHALNADTAISASHALNADSALAADTATSASHAVNADTAISSSHALNADNAISAALADSATTAITADNTAVTGKALELLTIPKGAPVYFTGSGTSGNIVGLYLADAGNPARMPAGGVAGENITPGEEGIVFLDGFLNNVNTSIFGSGDEVFVAVGGGYTNEAPTGSGNLIQKLGNVEKVAINGSGVIQMDGESRGLPNLTQANVWVGNIDDVPQETAVNTLSVATSSLALDVDSAAELNVASITASFASFASASIGYLQTVTGSATIIGESIIVLNNDTPTQRFAGIAVYDSGSANTTASLEFDGASNDWFYEYSNDGGVTTDHGVAMFGPEYSVKGSPTYPTANTILKGDGGHHVEDTNITDDGTTVKINSNTQITGSLGVSGGITATLTGNASTATTASYAVSAGTAVTASYVDGIAVVKGAGTDSLESYNATGNQGASSIALGRVASATGNFAIALGDGAVASNNQSTAIGEGAISSHERSIAIGNGATTTAADQIQLKGNVVAANGITANLTGNVIGNASTATSANTATSASHAIISDSALAANTATSASHALIADSALIADTATSASFASSIGALVSGSITHLETDDIIVAGYAINTPITLSVTSLTASIDCSLSNTFTITLPATDDTHFILANKQIGQVINIGITQNATTAGTISFSSDFKFPAGTAPTMTTDLSAIDNISMISYDGSIYLANATQAYS